MGNVPETSPDYWFEMKNSLPSYQPYEITTMKLYSKLIFTTDGHFVSFEPTSIGLFTANEYFDDYFGEHLIGFFSMEELKNALANTQLLGGLYSGSVQPQRMLSGFSTLQRID